MNSEIILLIVALAIVTYLTRCSGYLMIRSFNRIHPRVEAALNAVPAAVMTAIVAPTLLTHGWLEASAIAVAGLVSLRFGMIGVVVAGVIIVMLGRNLAGL